MRSVAMSLVLATVIFGSGPAARAQDAAVTMTPDRVHLLVNEQLGDERWSISMNLSSADPSKVVSVTGNVYRADGDKVSFVHCAVRPDSTGTLSDPSSTFRFTCRGANDCDHNALVCARIGWQRISTDVQIPASFFLPPGGLGTAADTTASSTVGARVARLLDGVWRRLRTSLPALSPRDAVAQTSELAGATLTPDLLNHLVVRDRSGQRWSIAFNVVRDDTRAGGFKATSVTGNIIASDGAVSFVYCVPRSGSPVTLEDPSVEMHFVCLGAAGCDTTAEECAGEWTTITDDAPITASFFLPEKGRGTPQSSEARMVLLGSTRDVPAVASEEYKGSGSGSCDEGSACIVDRIGSCEDVRGRLTEVDGECRCYVAPMSPYCLRTGTESTARIPAACGESCEFQVGVPEEGAGILRTARGVSLPFEADSPNCYCFANPPDRLRAVEVCGGVDDEPCADEGRCCVDDPRDGCDPLAGDAGCSGICIAPSESTAADAPHCAKQTLADQFCGDGKVQGSEVCDPAVSPAQSCTSLGFSGGTLDCSGCVPVGCTGNDEPPVITSLEALSATIDAYSRHPVRGTFSDSDGDVTAAVITNGSKETTYDLAVAGRRSGTFEVFVACNGLTGDAGQIDFTLDLVDADENQTEEPKSISSQCTAPPLCGDGVKEGQEQCDPGSDDPADACTDGQVCRNDCTCGDPSSCADRCCPELDGFCGHEELACRCDAHCRDADRNDCCADAKAECGL
jgi:hypothetical protein